MTDGRGPALRWYDPAGPPPAWWPDDGLDEERRHWLPRTAGPAGGVAIGDTGIGEIKPHTERGIKEGIAQLRSYEAYPGTRVLITYTPLNAADRMTRSGRASGVEVQAVRWADKEALKQRRASPLVWALIGRQALPATIPFPTVDNGGLFGAAVEQYVRRLFVRDVVRKAKRTARSGTGGAAAGPDVVWDELAAFYAELAGETGDPWLAELAEALVGA